MTLAAKMTSMAQAIGADVKALWAAINGNTTSIVAHDTSIQNLNTSVSTLNTQEANHDSSIQNLNSSVSSLNSSVSALIANQYLIFKWTYTDEAARLAATSFISADVNKIALQLSDNTIWRLVDTTPTWAAVGGSGTGGGGGYTFSDTPPDNPTLGWRWFKPSTGIEYTWIEDNDTGQWVDLGSRGVQIAANRTVTVPYAATLTLNCATYDTFVITLAGNPTITLTGATDEQPVTLRLKQDATAGRTVTVTNGRFSDDIPSLGLSTAANKTDRVGLRYNAADNKYDFVAVIRGF